MSKDTDSPKKTSKPLLFSDELPPTERFNPKNFRGRGVDPSRIEGYSEVVQANDIDKADDFIFREQNGFSKEEAYAMIGAHPQELPVEFRWLRVCGAGGAESPTAARELDRAVTQEGFRPATEEDLERYGYQLSPNARKAPDGTIRRGADVALYVRSGEVARMWEEHMAEEARKAEGAPPESFSAGNHATETFVEEERETAHIAH